MCLEYFVQSTLSEKNWAMPMPKKTLEKAGSLRGPMNDVTSMHPYKTREINERFLCLIELVL
jgi:hypothetical protein